MYEKYKELFDWHLNWVKAQFKKDEDIKKRKLERQICENHKHRLIGMLELMEETGEITWKQRNEEQEKLNKAFAFDDLIGEKGQADE